MHKYRSPYATKYGGHPYLMLLLATSLLSSFISRNVVNAETRSRDHRHNLRNRQKERSPAHQVFSLANIFPPSTTPNQNSPSIHSLPIQPQDTATATAIGIATANNPTPVNLTLLIETQGWGNETSWEVRDTDYNLIAADEGLENDLMYDISLHLPSGCYIVTIRDSGGDGLCCENGQGSYEVYMDGVRAVEGAEFGSGRTDYLCSTAQMILTEPTPDSTHCTANEFEITFRLQTDVHGHDTSWKIADQLGNTFASGGQLEPNTLYTTRKCVSKGCYILTMQDRQGDSYYELYVDGDLKVKGGGFVHEDPQSFCHHKYDCYEDEFEMTLELSTDQYGSDTSWEITTAAAHKVESQTNFESNNVYFLQQCLLLGCYEFTIRDSNGDGICCGFGEGGYALYIDGDLKLSGGEFTSEDTHSFCAEKAPSNPQTSTSSPFSNESSRNCYDKWGTLKEDIEASKSDRYVLCPNTEFDAEERTIIIATHGVSILCGEDGEKTNDCTLTGWGIHFALRANGIQFQGITFRNCRGGIMTSTYGASATFKRCDFTKNKNDWGAAIGDFSGIHGSILPEVGSFNGGAFIKFEETTFVENSGGYGVFHSLEASLFFDRCEFIHNRATFEYYASVISIFAGQLFLKQTCFIGNRGNGSSTIYIPSRDWLALNSQSFGKDNQNTWQSCDSLEYYDNGESICAPFTDWQCHA